jgi:hypothetical protein
MIMKKIIAVIFLIGFFTNQAGAQTETSSHKNAQIKVINEPVISSVQAATTATLVSKSRIAVTSEVPIENKTETTPATTEIISTERKP